MNGTDDELHGVTVDLDDVSKAKDRGALIRPRADRRTDVYGVLYDGTPL
jgi:hypothetical protein